MSKKIEILLLCLFMASTIHYTHAQFQGGVIDLRLLSKSNSITKSSAPNLQVQSIYTALKSKESLTFIDPFGGSFESTFEKIEVADRSNFHIVSDQRTERINLIPTHYEYYHSLKTDVNPTEIFFKINSKEVIGNWIGEEYVFEFDSERSLIEKYDRSTKSANTKVNNHQCSDEIGKKSTFSSGNIKNITSAKSLNIGVILDYSYINSAGGLQLAVDKLISVLASSSVDFKTHFNTEIQFEISDIVLSGCETCDPWTSSTNSAEVQESVRDWVQGSEVFKQNDIILFWSDRDFDDDIIGSAQTNSVCTEYNTIVLKDKSDVLWELRVIASHEIGHAIGSLHDSNFSNTIMHPSLINSSIWSAASKHAINEVINSASCLNDISDDCDEIRNITVTSLNTSQMRISFDGGVADSVLVEVINLSTGLKESEQIATSSTSWIDEVYIPCQGYSILLSPYCDDKRGVSTKVLWNSRKEDSFLVESILPDACRVENGVSVYDLAIRISNPTSRTVLLTYKELEYNMFLYEGIHTYVIPDIATNGEKDIDLYFVEDTPATPGCLGLYYVDEPSIDCAFQYVESFDNCSLPSGWSSYNSEGSIHEDFLWKFENGDRAIQNYGNAGNAQTTKTIDGSCMAVLDDDLINLSNHSGLAYLESSTFNLEKYNSIALSFDLIFDEFIEKGNGESHLLIEVFKDDTWFEIARIMDNPCAWFNIWNESCIEHMNIDLTPFKSRSMAVRWQFSDGDTGKWTGMAALDNVLIEARVLNINPCNYEDIHIDDSPTDNISTSGNMLYVSTMIDISEANFSLSQGAIFSPGSTVETGVNLNVAINPCDQ